MWCEAFGQGAHEAGFGELERADGFVGKPSFMVRTFQCATADGGFGETQIPGMERRESLVQADIVGRLRQGS